MVYHMYVRIQLLTVWTFREVLPTIVQDIQKSIEAVEAAATRISILKPGSDLRRRWDSVKLMILDCACRDGGDVIHADHEYASAANAILAEIGHKTSRRVFGIVMYLQNMQALAGGTSVGIMVPSDAVHKYLATVSNLDRPFMSEDYLSSMDSIGQLMQDALSRQLSVAEIEKIHMTFVWQTENVLTHLNADQLTESESNPLSASVQSTVFPRPTCREECKALLSEALVISISCFDLPCCTYYSTYTLVRTC